MRRKRKFLVSTSKLFSDGRKSTSDYKKGGLRKSALISIFIKK